MLPPSVELLAQELKKFPGLGTRSSRKLALDMVQLDEAEYGEIIRAMHQVRSNVGICPECGFYSEKNSSGEANLCSICSQRKRNPAQICVVEKPTDVITVEKSEDYVGRYHVLQNLISPLDNVFAEDTTLADLLDRRLPEVVRENPNTQIELILFFKAGFSAEATIAYMKERLNDMPYKHLVSVTKLAQGLPLYFNPDTLDQATMSIALSDRRAI